MNDSIFVLHAVAQTVLVPPGSLFILIASGLLLTPRRPALGRGLAWGGALSLLLLSLPWAAHALTRAAGDFAPISASGTGDAQAVVILASEDREAREYAGGYTVGDRTLGRLRYGARIAKQAGLPMLLSGGRVGKGDYLSLADLMQSVLSEDFGMSARWLETRSRNTRENARFSAPILRAAGVTTVVLVTDDSHMRRASREFTSAGIRVLPAPVSIPPLNDGFGWVDLAPSAQSLRSSSMAIYELLGQVEQWFALRDQPGRP